MTPPFPHLQGEGLRVGSLDLLPVLRINDDRHRPVIN